MGQRKRRPSKWRTWEEVPRAEQIRILVKNYNEHIATRLSTMRIKPTKLPLIGLPKSVIVPHYIPVRYSLPTGTPAERLSKKRLNYLGFSADTILFTPNLHPIDVEITRERIVVAREILRLRTHFAGRASIFAAYKFSEDNGIEVWEVATKVHAGCAVVIRFLSRFVTLKGVIWCSSTHATPQKALKTAQVAYSEMMVTRLTGRQAA